MKVIYRRAIVDDAYGVEYVAAYSWKDTYSGLLPDEYLNTRIKQIDIRKEKTREFLRNNPNYLVATTDDNKVIGICYYCDCNIDKYDGYGRIGALYLLKEYQGLGIGKELFKLGIKGLIDMGYDKMELECMQGNSAVNFYKKYLGRIVESIDYPIGDVCSVKADVLVFDDIKNLCEKEKM